MRTKKIIKESDEAIEKNLKRLFEITGSYTITPKGVVVTGDMQNKLDRDGQDMPELPFKVYSVSGRFTLENCKLKSVANFPDKVAKLDITNNPVKSLVGLENIEGLLLLEATGCGGLVDLKGCPAADRMNFKNCKELRSTEGINLSRATEIDFSKSEKLTDVTSLIEHNPDLKTKIKITYNEKLPLIKITLLSGRAGYPSITLDTKSNTKLSSLFTDYQSKGWANAIEFMRKLNDLGFGDNAKL